MAESRSIEQVNHCREPISLRRRIKYYQAINIVGVTAVFLPGLLARTIITGGEFRFFSAANLSVLAQQVPVTAIAAIGVGLLTVSGEFDISIAGTFRA